MKGENTMKLIDFCSIRTIQVQTVSRYIERHPELFEGHVSKDGQYSVLDEIAENILAEKYPIKPVEVSGEQLKLLQELLEKEKEINLLKSNINNLLSEMNKLSGVQYLLESKTSELEEIKEDSKKLERSIFDLEKQNQDLLKELESVKKEKERLENRNFFQRLFNK